MSEDQNVIEAIATRVMKKFGCSDRVAVLALHRKVELMTKTKVYSAENMLAAEKKVNGSNISAAEDLLSECSLFYMLGGSPRKKTFESVKELLKYDFLKNKDS